jgi:hypothetical protein
MERLDREEALLLACLSFSSDSGLGTSGKSGRGLLGASPIALPEETNPECNLAGLVDGFNATDSISGSLGVVSSRLFPSASRVMAVSVSVLVVGAGPKIERLPNDDCL